MVKPTLTFKEFPKEPPISMCSEKGGRIMFTHPDIKENDFKIDKHMDYEWSVYEGKSMKLIAEGTKGNEKIYILNEWINNIKLWLVSHFELGWVKYPNAFKFGFAIDDIDKPIDIVIRVKIYFEDNYWGIWEKRYFGIVKLPLGDKHETFTIRITFIGFIGTRLFTRIC